jgi:hypothetical protein
MATSRLPRLLGACKGCGLYVEECIDLRYCPGEKVKRPTKNDRLRRQIESDPDFEIEAGHRLETAWPGCATFQGGKPMSYSIGAQRATKSELSDAIAAKLAKVPDQQPVHKVDIDQAIAASSSLIALMTDDPERDLYCSVSGSVWQKETGIEQLNLNVSLNYQPKKAA